jgi:hypothetical protein
MKKAKHKWRKYSSYNTYFDAIVTRSRMLECEYCKITKRQVQNGMRYDFLDGTHQIGGKTPPCTQTELKL